VAKGIQQFNRHAFFRCHDSIEAVWVEEKSDARFLYQGLLQVGVAFYHVQRGNLRGAAKMMARGKGKLLPFLPVCQGIDVQGLMEQMARCEDALTQSEARWLNDVEWYPEIRLSP
jgi:predicted metal-dependent hydrolase